MTKDEAKTVLMDTFKAAWCADCHVSGELTYHNCNKYCGAYEQFKEALDALSEPSIVRCKDCKHYIVEGITTQYGWCHEYKHSVDEDDYCSYGERECNYFGERKKP